MYHSIQIIGRVSKDVILRDGDTSPVVTFSVATNRKYHTPDGKMEVQTHWFRVTVRGQQAVSCANILKKSDVVFIEGRLIADRDKGTPRIYEGNDGPNAALHFYPKRTSQKRTLLKNQHKLALQEIERLRRLLDHLKHCYEKKYFDVIDECFRRWFYEMQNRRRADVAIALEEKNDSTGLSNQTMGDEWWSYSI
jgi:hypothetical protein